MSCTGFLLDPGLFSNKASLSEAVWPAQLHPISLSFVSWSLRLLAVVKLCARLPEVPLWYQGSGQNDTVGGVSPFRALTCGTRCRQEFALSSESQISSKENLNIIQCSNNHSTSEVFFTRGALQMFSTTSSWLGYTTLIDSFKACIQLFVKQFKTKWYMESWIIEWNRIIGGVLTVAYTSPCPKEPVMTTEKRVHGNPQEKWNFDHTLNPP